MPQLALIEVQGMVLNICCAEDCSGKDKLLITIVSGVEGAPIYPSPSIRKRNLGPS